MSYILDALRRADAERERGAVPGLHAQPLPMAPPQAGGPSRLALWGGVAAALLLAAGLAAVGWGLRGGNEPPASAASAGPPVAVAQAPTSPMATKPVNSAADAPSAEPASPGPAVTQQAAPGRAASPSPAARELPRSSDAAQALRPTRPAATRTDERAAAPPRRAPAVAKADPASDATTPTSAPPRRILSLDELPADIRRGLPSVKVSGSIYSEDAASRFVMINGEAVREGGQVTPELVLEQIQLKSAVLRYKGYRYRIPL